jgi:hypothetical protein
MMINPLKLKQLYEKGANINSFLRDEMGVEHSTREIIEISYDLQAGSYTRIMEGEALAKIMKEYSREIVRRIHNLCEPKSILEAGVGEATVFSGVLENLSNEVSSYGFDLSWSRLAYAKKWLHGKGIHGTALCSGDLSHIPFLDSSIDIVYTSHSIEPNRNSEKSILQELYRVTRKFLILLEPGYELVGDEVREIMDSKSYCKNLKGISESLGYNVLEHELFPVNVDRLNPTAVTIIQKTAVDKETCIPSNIYACPKFKTPLKVVDGMFFSPEALVVYPTIGGIPCLRIENGVFASKYEEMLKTAD